jgi:hypothetical protein
VERTGRRREWCVACLDRLSSNSGGGVGGGVMIEGGAVGETRSSRHSLRVCWTAGLGGFVADVVMVLRTGTGTGTDWKAWMGMASKNSWATINGLFVASASKSDNVDKPEHDVHTSWNELDVFYPYHFRTRYAFANTLMTHLMFLQGGIATKKLSLCFPQYRAGLDQEYRVNR